MRDSIVDKVANIRMDISGSFCKKMQEALEMYHDMVNTGKLTPRGNNVSNYTFNQDVLDSNCYTSKD